MGRVFVHMSVSVDGFFEGPDADISWGLVDDEVHAFINDALRPVATYVLGRRSYELMQAYWPTADRDPAASPEVLDFARQWQSTPKVVVSRTLPSVADGDTLVRDLDAGLVRSLAARGDVSVGGAELAGQLLTLGLVEEVLLYVHPVLIGTGRPLFPPDVSTDLRLLASHTFGNGVVHLRYAVGDVLTR